MPPITKSNPVSNHKWQLCNNNWSYEVIYQNYTVYVKGDEELLCFKSNYGDPM